MRMTAQGEIDYSGARRNRWGGSKSLEERAGADQNDCLSFRRRFQCPHLGKMGARIDACPELRQSHEYDRSARKSSPNFPASGSGVGEFRFHRFLSALFLRHRRRDPGGSRFPNCLRSRRRSLAKLDRATCGNRRPRLQLQLAKEDLEVQNNYLAALKTELRCKLKSTGPSESALCRAARKQWAQHDLSRVQKV